MQATQTPRNSGVQNKSRGRSSRGRAKYKQDSLLRSTVESDEGGDSISGGSAQELGLVGVYPDHHCDEALFLAHKYKEVVHNVYCCAYCLMPLYQPYVFLDAKKLGEEIKKYGKDKAYGMRVKKNPRIRKALEILMAVHVTRRGLSSEEVKTAIRMVREHYGTQDDVELVELSSGRW